MVSMCNVGPTAMWVTIYGAQAKTNIQADIVRPVVVVNVIACLSVECYLFFASSTFYSVPLFCLVRLPEMICLLDLLHQNIFLLSVLMLIRLD